MICFPGGRELDWCRNYLSPFSQHSSPPKQRHQELDVTALPTVPLQQPKGKLLWEEQRGCTPFGLPHARCLISPL